MAQVKVTMPEDFLLAVAKLGEKTDEIIPKVLEAGGEVVLAKVKSNLQSVIGKNTKVESRSTGELVGALGMSKARQNRKGDWDIKIGFAEPRGGSGDSNAKIANIIEFGKSGQPAKPFLKPARSSSKKAAVAAMTAKLEEEVGKI